MPLSSGVSSSSTSKQSSIWRSVVGPTTMPPSGAMFCRRAATLTVSPSAFQGSPSPSASMPTTTGPVLIPIRTASSMP